MKSQQYKQGHIGAWKSSGMSQATYCREQGLNVKTFGNWLRTYRNGCTGNQPATLVPVMIKPATPSTDTLKLRSSGNHVLEIPADVSPRWLGELLRCLD